ncbi:MAG: hypothetical protein DME24_18015 [Verrucomicrobia bacterium]|nr:MAG: hypothetical protein DME24_18015 [Verrucomicrobiota bacterium]
MNALSASDRALIDYLEGPNEGDSTPTWQSLQSAQWFTGFWTNLSPLIAAAGFKPCIGSIAVGNPPGTPSQIQSNISTFVPALRQAKSLGGAWSYHAYTINYTTDTGVEYYYSLRYRQFYSQFASQYPDLADMPLILTEGGVDQSGTPATSGWQARGTAADYERWLNWFDHQLAQDSYVFGCTLFEIGNPGGWSSFDLEPIAGWLGNYLITPANPPPAPTGLVGVATNATALLIWTSAPLNPTTYNVKRSRTSGGPYTTMATHVTEGVKATAYTDSAVTNGGTYYYVVSAVNAAGEGPNSSQVTVTMPNTNLPDVIVTAVSWTPNPAFANNNVTFRATVKNQGTAPTPSNVTLGVGFSIDGGPNVTWSGGYTRAIFPGASVILTADGGPTGSSTWKATPGMHTLTATADDINRFPESNEGNNAMSVKLAISSGAPRISQIGVSTNNVLKFTFSATGGIHYQVQFKNDLSGGQWSDLGAETTANSNTVPVSDNLSGVTQRFYRVLQLN